MITLFVQNVSNKDNMNFVSNFYNYFINNDLFKITLLLIFIDISI